LREQVDAAGLGREVAVLQGREMVDPATIAYPPVTSVATKLVP
jgi:hypothetical protein